MKEAIGQVTPTEADIQRGFALVRNAREALTALPERRLSEGSRKKYESLFSRMREIGRKPEEIAGTRASFYVYRAAMNYGLVAEIQGVLRAADRHAKSKDRGAWWAEVLRLREMLALLRRYLPDPAGERVKSGEKATVTPPRGKSQSKRTGLKRLPDDWRERFWRAVPQNSKYRMAIAASIVTGVRPAELVKGVDVRATPNGDLTFDIRGAKTQGGRYGQVARRLTVEAPGIVGDFIRRALEGVPSIKVRVDDARLFGNQVSAFGRKCWPRKEERISPYSMRHQFAADLKASVDPDAVSLALGHAVADTAQHYGTARQSKKGGAKLLAVETTRELVKSRKLQKARAIERFSEGGRSRGR
jgi:integrase